MKHIIYTCTSLLLGLLLLAGCSQDLVPDEQTLSVSTTELVMSGGGSEATLEVKASATDWSYLCGASWLHLVRSGSQLRCTAEENRTGANRSAKIVLTSGRLVEEVEIRQLATNSSISADATEIHATQWGGTFTITVTAGHTDWEAVASEGWIQLSANPVKGTIVLTVAETQERLERSATLLIRDRQTGNASEVQVKQDAILYLLLPYLKFNDGMKAIEDFELARRSVVLERPNPNGGYGANLDLLKVRTMSPLFYRIEYYIKDDRMTKATMYAPFQTIEEEAMVIDWLKGKGFQHEGGTRFYNPDQRCIVERGVARTGNEWYLRFSYKPVQPQAQPTFASLPQGIVSEQNYQSFGRAQIDAWEVARSGEHNASSDSKDALENTETFVYFREPSAEYPFTMTKYTISTAVAHERTPLRMVLHALPDTKEYCDKVFWIHEGKAELTEEFYALVRSNGYIYQGLTADGRHVFYNDSRKTYMGVNYVMPRLGSTLSPFVTIEYHYHNPE
ncbi:MAG: BACON domain-containing protein [Porphyromonas sp.]|nr:BACON domain-containing protein [Porphyromonas sp.]